MSISFTKKTLTPPPSPPPPVHGNLLEAKSDLHRENTLNQVGISLWKPSPVASAEPSMGNTRYCVDTEPHPALGAKAGNDPDSSRLFSPQKHCHKYPPEDGFLCYLLFLHLLDIITTIDRQLFTMYSGYPGSCPRYLQRTFHSF